MKNWLYFPMILMLLASCKNEKTAPVPTPEPVALDPVLTLAVSKNSVTTGDTLTVFCKTENAVRTENNIGAPTTPKWKYTFKITENQKIIVSAVNKVGKTVTSDKDVTAVAYVPTRTDTISLSCWYLSDWEKLENGVVVKSLILTEEQKKEKYFFYSDFNLKVFSSSGVIVGSGSWCWSGSSLIIGTTTYFKYVMTNKLLVLTYNLIALDGTNEIWKKTYWRP